MQIQNRAFIVTGGASGLGAATARRLAAAGGRVVIADLDRKAGQALAAELGAEARFAPTDVTSGPDAEAAVGLCRTAFGAVHGLINCAGTAPAEKIIGRRGLHRLESFARTIEINLIGTFNMLRLAAAAMADAAPDPEGERGVIVNTASIAAFDGQIAQAGYAASKGGVVAMTLPIARELALHGIRVIAVAPGMFATPMLAAMPGELQESLSRSVPFPPRFGHPDEFARLVEHIIGNTYINGTFIRLDGAVRMAAR